MLRYWPILLWLVYFLFPFDLIPDTIPGIGRIDDILLLAYLYWAFMRKGRSGSTRQSARSQYGAGYSGAGASENGGSTGGQKRPSRDPYGILGVGPAATSSDIKRAYRLQASRYHPDKVSHLGEELQILAKEKFQEIHWAYEELIKRKGQA